MARTGIGKGNHANSRKNLNKWQPGKSGNPKGRPPNIKYVSEALRDLLASDKTLADKLARKLANRALKNSYDLSLLFERTEGKVTQPIEADIETKVKWVIGKGYDNEGSRAGTETDKQAAG